MTHLRPERLFTVTELPEIAANRTGRGRAIEVARITDVADRRPGDERLSGIPACLTSIACRPVGQTMLTEAVRARLLLDNTVN